MQTSLVEQIRELNFRVGEQEQALGERDAIIGELRFLNNNMKQHIIELQEENKRLRLLVLWGVTK